jgi:hypothetical protein
VTTANQDPLICMPLSLVVCMDLILIAHVPVIGVDIWEHVSCHSKLRLEKGAHVPIQAFYLQARSQVIFSSDPDTNSTSSSQYQNVKADVRIPNSLLMTNLSHFVPVSERGMECYQLQRSRTTICGGKRVTEHGTTSHFGPFNNVFGP